MFLILPFIVALNGDLSLPCMFIEASSIYRLLWVGVFMDVNYSLVGERIAARRKQLKLTQAELAEKASLTSKYISKIESSTNRALSISSVLQLCGALSVSPSFLLLGINDSDPSTEYENTAQKLKLCNPEQLRYVSKFIDAITSD